MVRATGVALSAAAGCFQPCGLWADADPPERVMLSAPRSLIAPSLPFELSRIGLSDPDGALRGVLVAIGV